MIGTAVRVGGVVFVGVHLLATIVLGERVLGGPHVVFGVGTFVHLVVPLDAHFDLAHSVCLLVLCEERLYPFAS